jgi:hypothetical protein
MQHQGGDEHGSRRGRDQAHGPAAHRLFGATRRGVVQGPGQPLSQRLTLLRPQRGARQGGLELLLESLLEAGQVPAPLATGQVLLEVRPVLLVELAVQIDVNELFHVLAVHGVSSAFGCGNRRGRPPPLPRWVHS